MTEWILSPTNTLEWVHLTPADGEAYAQFLYRLERDRMFRIFEEGELPDAAAAAAEIARIIRAGGWVWALRHATTIVGHCQAIRGHLRIDSGNLFLLMEILAHHTGQGWGSRWLNAALTEARMRGWHRVELTVLESNWRAIHLYQRFGFREEGRLEF